MKSEQIKQAIDEARSATMQLECAVAQMVINFEGATGLRVEHIAVTRYNPQNAYPMDAKTSCKARVVL